MMINNMKLDIVFDSTSGSAVYVEFEEVCYCYPGYGPGTASVLVYYRIQYWPFVELPMVLICIQAP